jgi:hypothetical protein
MKTFICLMLLSSSLFAQTLWERNEKLLCVDTKTDVEQIKIKLKKKFGRDCDYLRDATRSVIGSIFKCPDDKLYPYFRTQDSCKMFFTEGKKDLLKFAPSYAKDPKKWTQTFGTCMETATQKQINNMGLKTLNVFCYCVAGQTTVSITSAIVEQCSKKLN